MNTYWVLGLRYRQQTFIHRNDRPGYCKQSTGRANGGVQFALQKRSVAIITVHNHPSGNLTPSEADKRITDQLIQVGDFLRVPVLDSLIISEKSYYSFADSKLLDQLKEHSMYKLPYKEQQRLLTKAEEIGRREGHKDVARELKARGIDLETIATVTGLSIEEIKKLKPRKTK